MTNGLLKLISVSNVVVLPDVMKPALTGMSSRVAGDKKLCPTLKKRIELKQEYFSMSLLLVVRCGTAYYLNHNTILLQYCSMLSIRAYIYCVFFTFSSAK